MEVNINFLNWESIVVCRGDVTVGKMQEACSGSMSRLSILVSLMPYIDLEF